MSASSPGGQGCVKTQHWFALTRSEQSRFLGNGSPLDACTIASQAAIDVLQTSCSPVVLSTHRMQSFHTAWARSRRRICSYKGKPQRDARVAKPPGTISRQFSVERTCPIACEKQRHTLQWCLVVDRTLRRTVHARQSCRRSTSQTECLGLL